MIDREKSGLRGKVKTCSTEHTVKYPDHDWVMRTDDSFSPEGRLLERRHRNGDGSHWSHIYTYDEHGRLLRKEVIGGTPDDRHVFSYQYDQVGRLENVLYSAKEAGRTFESVRYAADGTKTETSYPIWPDDIKRPTTVVSAGDAFHMSIDAVTIMTSFDMNGRPIRKVLYDEDDRVIRRVGFRYNERGLLIEEGELIAGRIREDFRNFYKYDAAGREIEVDRRRGDGLGGERRTFTYNDRGDVVQEQIVVNDGMLSEVAALREWTERFAYEYDLHGNWIERRTETILKTGGSGISTVDRRELVYY